MHDVEIWKAIPGYEGIYEVSSKGQVRSLNYRHTGKPGILKVRDDKGYLTIGLNHNGKRHDYRIHRLVAEAFIPNPNNLPQINHKDENKYNNCVNNLEWCTAQYNVNYGTARERQRQKMMIPVYGTNINNGTIIRFEGMVEACKYLKSIGFTTANTTNICNCCKGSQKSAYGYTWNYSEGE